MAIRAPEGFRFGSTKTYPHSIGLSCCFRQWRALHSHCRFLHGYALQVKLTFTASDLDERNWVIDFGGLNYIKSRLQYMLDHKTLVAKDDPHIEWFKEGHKLGILDPTFVQSTGCEAMAQVIFEYVHDILFEEPLPPHPDVSLQRVEVWEHEGNSAFYERTSQ